MATLESTVYRSQGYTIESTRDRLDITIHAEHTLNGVARMHSIAGMLRWFTSGQAIGPLNWEG